MNKELWDAFIISIDIEHYIISVLDEMKTGQTNSEFIKDIKAAYANNQDVRRLFERIRGRMILNTMQRNPDDLEYLRRITL